MLWAFKLSTPPHALPQATEYNTTEGLLVNEQISVIKVSKHKGLPSTVDWTLDPVDARVFKRFWKNCLVSCEVTTETWSVGHNAIPWG